MKYGYLRVSTPAQSYGQQEAELRTYGVRIFEKEVVSGRKTQRPVLTAVLEELRRGDELHITKLDRLGRTARELHEIARTLEERGVALVIGGTKHDPTTPTGKLVFGMFALFAELEADFNAERTRERLAYLKAQGKPIGKKKVLTERQEIALFHAVEAGHTLTSLADRYKVSRTTVRRALDRQKLKRQLKDDPELRRELRAIQVDHARVESELDAALAEARAGGEQ